jgi:hypothetical protein
MSIVFDTLQSSGRTAEPEPDPDHPSGGIVDSSMVMTVVIHIKPII